MGVLLGRAGRVQGDVGDEGVLDVDQHFDAGPVGENLDLEGVGGEEAVGQRVGDLTLQTEREFGIGDFPDAGFQIGSDGVELPAIERCFEARLDDVSNATLPGCQWWARSGAGSARSRCRRPG